MSIPYSHTLHSQSPSTKMPPQSQPPSWDPIEQTARTTTANLSYLLPNGPRINRRFVSAGVEVNTGKYGPYPTTIRDARLIRAHFTLPKHGFTLLDASTSVSNFHDKAEVQAKYPAEVCGYVRAALGADFVVSRGWMLRTSGAIPKQVEAGSEEDTPGTKRPYRHHGGLQPPAGEVHVDTEPSRQLAHARQIYAEARSDGPGFKRFVVSSFWRTFSPPPQDCPLAVCDARSVRDDEGVPNVLWVVDRIPETEEERVREDLDGEGEGDEGKLAAAVFKWSGEHRWWYFSGMGRGEGLLFIFHDSSLGKGGEGGWRVPHCAFWDGSFGGEGEVNVRESVECRTFAFWE